MRVRDHLALSTLAAAALYPTLKRKALVPWAASLLIDVDHYAWFTIDRGSLSLMEAVRFFNQAQPPQHLATRRLHGPDVLLAVLLASFWWRPLRLVFYGLLFHVSLDVTHSVMTARARRRTLERDHATCRLCGARDASVVAHVWRQPSLMPSYRTKNLVSLCGSCHEVAHAKRIDFS